MLISVIIPVYNRKELLIEAILSVKNQTYKNYEIIVIDDGSDEDIESVCKNFFVKYFKIERSGKPSLVRNFGVGQSAGDYIAFLDSDDLWFPEKLEKQINHLKLFPDLKIVHTKEIWKRGEKIVSQKNQKHKKEGDVFYEALKKCIIGPSTVMIEKNFFLNIGGFDETIEVAEDYELWLRVSSLVKVFYIDEPLIVKRAGTWEQLSEKYGQIEKFRIEALLKFLQKKFVSGEKLKSTQLELQKKIEIYNVGAKKRGKSLMYID